MRRAWMVCLAFAACLPASCGSEQQAPAAPTAAQFIDSIGVNVHMSYSDTGYVHVEEVRRRLRELGVRHVRDGIVIGRPDQYRALNLLAADGIRAQLILGDPAGRFGTGTLDQQLATLERDLRDAAGAVEGPNEYDLSGDPDWVRRVRDYQARLAAAVAANPALSRLVVVGPSVGRAESRRQLGDLTGQMDLGNMHPYPGGQPPERNLNAELAAARANSGSLPVVASETGYHDALATPDSHPPVPEEVAAIYLPRLFLSAFRAGVRRTFAYELLDARSDPARADLQANFGLLHEDLSPKPSFTALRNLIAVVRPAGDRASGGPPDVTVRGSGVEQLLLDRGDGRFALVLWQPAPVWEPHTRRSIGAPDRRVTVELSPAVAVAVARPGRSAEPERRLARAQEVAVAVPPDVVVLLLDT